MTHDINVNHPDYWQNRYNEGTATWDMKQVSPTLQRYFDTKFSQLDKNAHILIAGAGNAHEAEYLHQQGFNNVIVVDFAQSPLDNFANKVPSFPKEHLVQSDFFLLDEQTYQFDYAIEQTFFCAIHPSRRAEYVDKMYELLKPNGMLVGVLFNTCALKGRSEDDIGSAPPFGGHIEDYRPLFTDKFIIHKMEDCYNSHPARQGREAFIELQTKKAHL